MIDDFDYSVAGQLVGGAHHKVATKPPGRVCAQRGCRTKLSVYNLHTRCDLHDFDASLAHFHVAPVDDLHRKMVAEGSSRLPMVVDRRQRFGRATQRREAG